MVVPHTAQAVHGGPDRALDLVDPTSLLPGPFSWIRRIPGSNGSRGQAAGSGARPRLLDAQQITDPEELLQFAARELDIRWVSPDSPGSKR